MTNAQCLIFLFDISHLILDILTFLADRVGKRGSVGVVEERVFSPRVEMI